MPSHQRGPNKQLLLLLLLGFLFIGTSECFSPHTVRQGLHRPSSSSTTSCRQRRSNAVYCPQQQKYLLLLSPHDKSDSTGTYSRRHKPPRQSHQHQETKLRQLVQLRGGSNHHEGDETEKKNPSPLTKFAEQCRQFGSKNFFLLGMFVAVGLARAMPSLGKSGGALRAELFIGKFGVACIFLLSGLSLELSELKQAASNHKLNTSVLLTTFGLWPFLVGLPLNSLLEHVFPNLLSAPLRDGLLILTCLPTTINMCVILTTAAGGSVATALWNAVISNLAGIFVTPMLLLRFFGKYIQLPFVDMIMKLCSQVLLPVAAGQALRQVGGKELYAKNKKLFKRLQEVILLSIVWNAFCNTFSNSALGLELGHAVSLFILIPVMHLLSLGVLFKAFSLPMFQFSRKEVVAAMFVASQKTLAFGLPLISTIFEGSPNIAAYCTPLMFVHPLQLILGSLFVPRLSRYIAGQGDNDIEKSK